MFHVFRCTVGDCALIDGTPTILLLTQDYGAVFACVYILMIMLVTFGIFNLIMATFVDNALKAAKRNEIHVKRQRLNDTQRQEKKTSELVHKLWRNQMNSLPEEERQKHFDVEEALQTTITKEVFNQTLECDEMQDLLEDLDVPEDDR